MVARVAGARNAATTGPPARHACDSKASEQIEQEVLTPVGRGSGFPGLSRERVLGGSQDLLMPVSNRAIGRYRPARKKAPPAFPPTVPLFVYGALFFVRALGAFYAHAPLNATRTWNLLSGLLGLDAALIRGPAGQGSLQQGPDKFRWKRVFLPSVTTDPDAWLTVVIDVGWRALVAVMK